MFTGWVGMTTSVTSKKEKEKLYFTVFGGKLGKSTVAAESTGVGLEDRNRDKNLVDSETTMSLLMSNPTLTRGSHHF